VEEDKIEDDNENDNDNDEDNFDDKTLWKKINDIPFLR
jgi:hypothetical protein